MAAHKFHRILPAALALAAFAAAGCGKSTSPVGSAAPITQQQANDVASQVGTLLLASGGPSPIPAALKIADPAKLSAIRPAGRFGAAAETTFVGDGVTWSFAMRWYDGLGHEQATYDPLTTVRMQADSRASGSMSSANGSITLGTAGHLDIAGISALQDTLRTNASQADTLDIAFSNDTTSVSFHLNCLGLASDVTEVKPRDLHYPVRGGVSWSMDVAKHASGPAGTVDEHYHATAEVSFNGTHLVPLVIDHTWHYTLDLDTGVATPDAV